LRARTVDSATTASRSLVISVSCLIVLAACSARSNDLSPGQLAPWRYDPVRAGRLFERHCSACHGEHGEGNGSPQPILFPPARDFTSGRFLLVSTDNGVPSDADLVKTIRNGMPGSAMPAFGWMLESELRDLAALVRAFAVDGLARDLEAEGVEHGSPLTEDRARRLAAQQMEPGEQIEVGPVAPWDEATLARGRKLFLELCADCHGEDGRGRPDEPRWSEDGSLRWARDFTQGFLKGGATHEEIAWRIRAGMPGSAMPATRLDSPRDLAALTAWVLSLIPPDAQRRLRLERGTIHVVRAETLPEDLDDPCWQAVQKTWVALMPLWWHDDSVKELAIQALHDGDDLLLRLSWSDATRDDGDPTQERFDDGAAVQISDDPEPALSGMGSHEHPTNLWHWRAGRFESQPDFGGSHRLHADPLAGDSVLDAPFVVRDRSAPPSETAAESIRAEGPDSVRSRPGASLDIAAHARWRDGEWCVTLSRSLAARSSAEVDLAPGRSLQAAFAVWNASAGDEGGRKAISIWQVLAIER
jgi:mono/diheme cytochrome c family protein